MSGEDVPYQLRPNKFIDRGLFMDLLSRLLPSLGTDKYVYVSMGGRHLIDHTAVYRQIGITNLFSFDLDDNVVLRQKFNRPIDSAVCEGMNSGKLPGKLDTIMAQFPDATNMVIWLDFTNPHDRLTQLQELVEVAKRLQPGDILRISINANLTTLEEGSSKWKDLRFPGPGEYRAACLKRQLGDFVPATLDAIGESDFPSILSECVSLAFSKAEDVVRTNVFKPLLLTTYRDGQRMMTATCVVARSSERSSEVPGLGGWQFLPANWSDVLAINAPDLSLREKLKIDERLSKTAKVVLDHLGFLPAKNEAKSIEAIASYQKLHRYYPAFHHIEA